MICRKDSLSFVDFMRGKYNITNTQHILNLITEMTITEKEMILNNETIYFSNNKNEFYSVDVKQE